MVAVLGITDGDDGGATIVVDGRLVAAVNEERLNRLKQSIGYPEKAIAEVLRLGNVDPSDIDHVAMAAHTETWMDGAQRNDGWFSEDNIGLTRFRQELASKLSRPLGNVEVARRMHTALKRLETIGRRRKVKEALRAVDVIAPISYHEHHRCHAVAAFAGSGFDEALTVTLDGSGDGSCSQVWLHNRKDQKRLNRLDSIHSIGNFYAYVTHLCGFKATIHEGKITGLAAHGDPEYLSLFRELIGYRDGQIVNDSCLYFTGAIQQLKNRLPTGWTRENLSASIQCHLEDVATSYVDYWLRKSGQRKLCVAGGVFANVRLNQKLIELPGCDEFFVFPAMGDGGLAAGAAWDWIRSKEIETNGIEHVYLGPSYDEREIVQSLESHGLEFSHHNDIESVVAQLVFDGNVVARYSGSMEYGPRALGARSILYTTTDPDVNNWLNDRLNRTEFMPFAPACLAGYERRLFDWNDAASTAVRYMTVTLNCSRYMRENCPAVVHIDGTARPQFVHRDTNASFYRILEQYYELSGIPAIVNTSFNMHEEPIVCTPDDAIRAFVRGHLDSLAIGNFLVGTRPTGNPP